MVELVFSITVPNMYNTITYVLLLVNMGLAQYLSRYQYTTSWNNKRRLVVVQGDNMVEQVMRSVQAEGINCQLSTRNLNIIFLSEDNPRDLAFYSNREPEVVNLNQEVVENIKNDIGQGSDDR